MNFNFLKYERVNYEDTQNIVIKLIKDLQDSFDKEEIILLVRKIIDIQNHIEEMYDLADIKNMRDSEDIFFREEINYWNNIKSKLDLLFLPFYELMGNSKYKEVLDDLMSDNFYEIINYQKKITSSAVIELQKQEVDILNVVLFKTTAKEWRKLNSKLAKTLNIRDYATINECII